MKVTLAVLCILPLVLCFPWRRFDLGNHTYNYGVFSCDIQLMLNVLGYEPTEEECEAECNSLSQLGNSFGLGCSTVCHQFKLFYHAFGLVPNFTHPNYTKCGDIVTSIVG